MDGRANETRETTRAAVTPPRRTAVEQLMRVLTRRLTPGLSAAGLREAYADWLAHLVRSPEKLAALAEEALREAGRFGLYTVRSTVTPGTPTYVEPEPHDRRFMAEQWRRWPFNLAYQSFLLTERWLQNGAKDVPGVSKHHEDVVAFTMRQILDFLSPSNVPLTNPEVLARTLAQGGANLHRGAVNFFEDWGRLVAGKRPVGAEAFVPGERVAVTPGKVVYRNHLVEILQYAPTTYLAQPEPVLLVPAWILKYYILDLSPHNSLVKYLVDRGHTVFTISWKSATEEDRDLSFEDYRTWGFMAALDAVSAIVPGRRVHTVGYCLGGTLLALAAAAMAREGDDRLQTITLFAAQVDFSQAGEITTFIDEAQIASLEDLMRAQGYLDTRQLVLPVLLLRACEFVWPLLLRQYLLGEREPMTDIMAWRTDATRMPCRMYSEYLRRFFLANDLAEGRYEVGGRTIALRDLDVPIFAVGALDDFVAPWRSVYGIHALTDTEVNFVLSTGDHHSGIIGDPDDRHRSFRSATKKKREACRDPETWKAKASCHEGSWWPDWEAWLVRHSGERTQPPSLGNPQAGYARICDAPGTYVFRTAVGHRGRYR